MLQDVRQGKLIVRPSARLGSLSGPVRKYARDEARETIGSTPGMESEAGSTGKQKTILFSFKANTRDLDKLKRLSEFEGESVAVLIRQAIRQYLGTKLVK